MSDAWAVAAARRARGVHWRPGQQVRLTEDHVGGRWSLIRPDQRLPGGPSYLVAHDADDKPMSVRFCEGQVGTLRAAVYDFGAFLNGTSAIVGWIIEAHDMPPGSVPSEFLELVEESGDVAHTV